MHQPMDQMDQKALDWETGAKALMQVLLVVLGAALGGCSHAPPAPSAALPAQDAREDSELKQASLEISYVLGHSLHRFVTTASPDNVRAEAFRDQQLLKESTIDPGKYTALVKQASELLDALVVKASQRPMSPCRSPFTLKIRNEHAIRSIDGCRSSDSGAAVGKLIRNAEVLLYSRD